MSGSIRFLGMAVLTWAAVRAVSLGLVPGGRAAADPLMDGPPAPAIAPTNLVPDGLFDAAPPAIAGDAASALPTAVPDLAPAPVAAAFVPAAPPPTRHRASLAPAYAAGLVDLPPGAWIDDTPMSRLASLARGTVPVPGPAASGGAAAMTPAPHASPPLPRQSVAPALAKKLDRLQLSAWAMMRQNTLAPGLARAGTLGGSQAGARLDYRFDRHLAATLRFSSAVQGPRGAEVAPGLRWRPFARQPFSLIAERRIAVGPHGGRSGFALLAEAGFWARPLPGKFRADGYLQAGVVGLRRNRTPFVDGALTATRPLHGQLRGGFGVWGGAQPHLWRLDAGPRLSLPLSKGMTAHVDYRRRVAGTAAPGDGAVATIAADF